jgi:hypothetical protein
MSKGMDRKRETKKKAAKSPDEKRAAKRDKKDAQQRGGTVAVKLDR